MIRIMLLATMLGFAVGAGAQSALALGAMGGGQMAFNQFNQQPDSSQLHKKWFTSRYIGLSSGFIAFNGGSGTFLSAPVGVQLNRRLTNNLYAFAGLSVTPAFLQFNNAFLRSDANKSNGFTNFNNFSTYSSAQMGLMYINDDRTFSISGSIGVSRSTYNGYSPFYTPANSRTAGNGFPVRK
ncbi:MAG: hypothetical protein QM731_01540 [Chitinophagaceae bacterium]